MTPPTQFVVMQECSAGNAEIGEMWTAAGTFPPTATLAEVWKWANSQGSGRTMLRPDATHRATEGRGA